MPDVPDQPDQPGKRPRPLAFYWVFGAIMVLIGIADLFAQRKNLLGLAPAAIGLMFWIIGLVAWRSRRKS